MMSARARLRAGVGVSFSACVVALACGSRTGVEACIGSWGQCSLAGAGQSTAPVAGAPSIGGQIGVAGRAEPPSAGAPQGGRAGAGGSAQGGRAGGSGGAPNSAGQGGSAGALVRE